MGAALPRVTVVIPTYNRWLMLRSAIWSAVHQEDVETRVIVVVDDGTADETRERLDGVEDDTLAVLYAGPPGGVSRARNLGLEHVETEWVAFLDDDDVWAPPHLAGLFDAMGRAGGEERIGLAYSGAVSITPERTVLQLRVGPEPSEAVDGLLSENALGPPSCVLLRADAVRAVGGFDPELAVTADWDLWLRAAPRVELAASPALSVGYTRHPGNLHLGVERALEELPRLDERYAERMRDRAVTFTDNCSRWIASSYRAAGRRRQAARWYLRTFRLERRPRDLGRAFGILLGERAIELSGQRRTVVFPPEITPWLEGIRFIDRLPSEEVPFGR